MWWCTLRSFCLLYTPASFILQYSVWLWSAFGMLRYGEGETRHCNSSTIYKVVSQTSNTQKCPEALELKLELRSELLCQFEALSLCGDGHCQTARVCCLQQKGRVIYLLWEGFEKLSIYIHSSFLLPLSLRISYKNISPSSATAGEGIVVAATTEVSLT